MPRLRFRYPMYGLLVVVATSAILLASWKAMERERVRRSLCTVRLTAATQNYERVLKRSSRGQIDFEPVYTWSRRVMEAQRDLASSSAERIAAIAAHRSRMEAIRKATTEASRESGRGLCLDDVQIGALDYSIKEADSWLATER